MKRLTKTLIAVIFPLLLIAYPASILLPIEPAEIENRPVTRPQWTADNLTRPGFYRDLLRYVRTANPARSLLVRVGAGIDYWVFHDSPDPTRVLYGLEGWLFYRPTFEEPCSAPPETVVANLLAFVSALEERSQMVVVTVTPSKLSIHPEYLTEQQRLLASCASASGARLRALLAGSPLSHYVDAWEIFDDLKESGMTHPYFRTDTHFHYQASIPWIRSLIDEIAPVWEASAVRDMGEVEFLGNLMSFIGLDETETVRRVVVQRLVTGDTDRLGPRLRRHRHRGDVPLIPGTALMLSDSFIELPEPSLVQYFEDITISDWREDASVQHFLTTADQADVVIVEIAELDIWGRFADDRFEKALGSE